MIGLTYSISDVHTHEYYAERAAALADCAEMDRLYLKDPGGLLTPDAVARARAALRRVPPATDVVELHSHCTIGLAPLVYLEGVKAGFQVVHTASGALSRGTSQPEVVQHGPQPRGDRVRAPTRPRRADGRLRALRSDRQGQGPPARRAARVRRGLLHPPAPRRDGHDHAADARGAAPPRAVRRRARGGHARPRRDGLSDPGHAGLAVRRQPGGPQRDRPRALGERVRRDDPLLPRPLRRAGGAGRSRHRRPRPVAAAGRQAPRPDADHPRRRARAVRPADLRGGAAASPDDARRSRSTR